MHATHLDQERIQSRIRQLRALIQSGQRQITQLRPVWGAYLLGETMSRLSGTVDDLEQEIGIEESSASGRSQDEEESGDLARKNDDQDIYL